MTDSLDTTKYIKECFYNIFPNYSLQGIAKLDLGFSDAQIYRVDAKEITLIARRSAGYFGRDGFVQEMRLQNHFAQLNFAPKVFYFNQNLMLSLSSYVHDVGLTELLKTDRDYGNKMLMELARLVHRAKVPIPIKELNIFDEIKKIVLKFKKDFLRKHVTEILNRVLAIKIPKNQLVLSHNDFHPNNILFDKKNLILIDWEMAGLFHPFYDIALLSNYLLLNKNDGYEILCCYLNSSATTSNKRTFDDLRKLGFAFLACINFLCSYSANTDLRDLTPFNSPLNFETLTDLWSRAARKKCVVTHYELGLFFIEQCKNF